MADLVFVVLRTEESDYNPRYTTTDVWHMDEPEDTWQNQKEILDVDFLRNNMEFMDDQK